MLAPTDAEFRETTATEPGQARDAAEAGRAIRRRRGRRDWRGRHLQHPKVTHHPAAVVTVDADRPLALHADGEWLGRWPSLTFQIVPGALHVVVPSDGMAAGERRP